MFLLKALGSVALVLVAFVSVSLCFEARATIRAGLKEKFDALHRQLKRGKWESAEINNPIWMDFDKALTQFFTQDMYYKLRRKLPSDFSLVLNMLIPLEAQLDACLRSNPDRNSSLKPTMGRLDEHVTKVEQDLQATIDSRLEILQRTIQGPPDIDSLLQLQRLACLLFTNTETCTPLKDGYVPKYGLRNARIRKNYQSSISQFIKKAWVSLRKSRNRIAAIEAWHILQHLNTLCGPLRLRDADLDTREPHHYDPAILEYQKNKKALEQSFDALVTVLSENDAGRTGQEDAVWRAFEASLNKYKATNDDLNAINMIKYELNMLVMLDKRVDWILGKTSEANKSLKLISDRLNNLIRNIEGRLIQNIESCFRYLSQGFEKHSGLYSAPFMMLRINACLLFKHNQSCGSPQSNYKPKNRGLFAEKKAIKKRIIDFMTQNKSAIDYASYNHPTTKGIVEELHSLCTLETPPNVSGGAEASTTDAPGDAKGAEPVLVSFAQHRENVRSALKKTFEELEQKLSKGIWESAEVKSLIWTNFDDALQTFFTDVLSDPESRTLSDFASVLNMLIRLEAQPNACRRGDLSGRWSPNYTIDRLDYHFKEVEEYLIQALQTSLRENADRLSTAQKLSEGYLEELQTLVCLLFTHSETCIPWKEGYVPTQRRSLVGIKQSLRQRILTFSEKAGQSIKLVPLEEQDEAWNISLPLGSLYSPGTIERPPTIESTASQSRIPAIPSDSEPRKTSIPTMAVVVCLGLGSVAALVGLKLAIRRMSVES